MAVEHASILAQIQSVRDSLPQDTAQNVRARSELLQAAKKLVADLESPGDICERVVYQYVEIASIKVAIDLGIFQILEAAHGRKSVAELAEKTKVDPVLMGRIMRSLASLLAVDNAGPELYTSNKVSRTFTIPKFAAGVKMSLDWAIPNWLQMPSWLEEIGYKNPSVGNDTTVKRAFKTDESGFEIISRIPGLLDAFSLHMSAFHEGRANWLDFYPVEEEMFNGFHKEDPKATMFIDIGGALGSEVVALKQKYPHCPGRLILEDLPYVVKQVGKTDAMEAIPYDMFTPQPVKGARVYYFRNVLHDWTDDKCREVLRTVSAAMTPGYSKILINEWVVSEEHPTSFMTIMDLTMMCVWASGERTAAQWKALVESVGLRIAKIYEPGDGVSESIIEVTLKDG
ncbi:hypothetical protein MMC34_004129 [Xylographa carneopallida]|nr:hypothetical protein [Xylographa carneopallida]